MLYPYLIKCHYPTPMKTTGGALLISLDGHTRISELESRGTLREIVTVIEVSDGVYFLTWEDEEMGALTQLIDLPGKRIFAAVPWKGKMEIWPAVITEFCEGRI